MLEKLKDRQNQMIVFFAVFMIVLLFRLLDLTIIEGDKYKSMADEIRMKKIPIPAPRGEIRDRYGRPLAVNQPSFSVQIMKNELIDEKINDVAVKLLNILIKNGEKIHDNFPIKIKNGQFYYTFDQEIQEWNIEHGIKNAKNAEEVFSQLREELGIDPSKDKYEAQKEMQTQYGVYPPISVKVMKFLPELKKQHFLQLYYLDEKLKAGEAFMGLREKFGIPEKMSNEDARKILVIRNEFKEQGYMQYQPVQVAINVSAKTVTQIEESSMDLPGVNIQVEPIRSYPNHYLASHVLGYLGKISDTEKEKYTKDKGYLPNDLIGKDGLERTYEEQLKGKDGARYVEVDVYGRLINVMSEEKPQKGKNLYLSIDANVQKVAEDALKQTLKKIQVGGTFKSKWGDYRFRSFPHATSGAVVALDIKNGEVLALANYPSFDPNLFATGISSKDWKNVQDQNPRDSLSPVPLYNVAARTAVQPGSTFKMITGLAAIENGMDPKKKLYDGGHIMLGGRSFGCWLWNDYHRSHGYVDLYKALAVSCNYYFYDVSTSFDYYKNKPLSISMGVENILEYTKMFGLGQSTGIELSETKPGVPNPDQKMRTIKILLERELKAKAKIYFEEKIVADHKKLKDSIDKIVSWIHENPSRGALIEKVKQVGAKEEKAESLADLVKFSYYNQARWTKGDTFNLAIGQGQHAYTPLQMARYIAAIANDGYLNPVHVVDKVGEEKIQHNKSEAKLPLKNQENLKHVRKGMESVAQSEEGTTTSFFRKFPVQVAGKTGTAQKSGKIQPKNEAEYLKNHLKQIAPYLSWQQIMNESTKYMDLYKNEGLAIRKAIKELSKGRVTDQTLDQFKDSYDSFGWFVSYAPSEDPQIAVVVLLFQAGHGNYGAPVAREIFGEYFGFDHEYKKVRENDTLTN